MDKKIIKIPISYDQRRKNEKGHGYVPCQISGRYLNFFMKSDVVNSEEWINVDVMTSDTNDGNDKILSRMIIKKDDILEVLNNINPKELD